MKKFMTSFTDNLQWLLGRCPNSGIGLSETFPERTSTTAKRFFRFYLLSFYPMEKEIIGNGLGAIQIMRDTLKGGVDNFARIIFLDTLLLRLLEVKSFV